MASKTSIVPPSDDLQEVMAWATETVLRLDEENQWLRGRLEEYEREGIPARAD